MISEGRGKVAPSLKSVRLDNGSMRLIVGEAKRRAKFRGYGMKNSKWGRGLQDGLVIPNVGALAKEERPIFVGILGEFVTALVLGRALNLPSLAVDLTLNQSGDGGKDLEVFDLLLQVKCCQKETAKNLIRVKDDRGRAVEIAADVFVFCQWLGSSTVSIRGWEWWANLKGYPPEASQYGHWNIDIPSEDLQPISSLVDALKARRLAS